MAPTSKVRRIQDGGNINLDKRNILILTPYHVLSRETERLIKQLDRHDSIDIILIGDKPKSKQKNELSRLDSITREVINVACENSDACTIVIPMENPPSKARKNGPMDLAVMIEHFLDTMTDQKFKLSIPMLHKYIDRGTFSRDIEKYKNLVGFYTTVDMATRHIISLARKTKQDHEQALYRFYNPTSRNHFTISRPFQNIGRV
jgi:hypothetical protein